MAVELPVDQGQVPLLADYNRLSPPPSLRSGEAVRPRRQRLAEHFRKWRNIYLCCVLIATLELPSFLAAAPGIQLMEDAICREMHGEQYVSGERCQDPDVQSRLAGTRGLLAVMMTVPSLFLAVPYGMLADSRGRKFVASLAILSALCCFTWTFSVFYLHPLVPFSLIYVYPLFLAVGGGGFVAGSVITAICSDLVPSDEVRTRAFFFIGVVGRIIGAVAPPIGAGIMTRFGPLFAYFLTIPASLLPIIPLMLLPETAGQRPREARARSEDHDGGKKFNPRASISNMLEHVKRDFLPLLRSWPILCCLLTFMLATFVMAIGEIILQYMKNRFGWEYAEATVVIAFQATIQIIFLCTLLPLAHKFLTNRYPAQHADLLLAKISLWFDTLCLLILGLSSTPIGAFIGVLIGSLGIGFGGAMRGYVTSLVPRHDVALLYTLIGTAGAVGSLFAAPLLQGSFSVGLKIGGMGLGLPFFICSGLFAVAGMLMLTLKPEPAQGEYTRAGQDDDEEEEGAEGT